MQFKDIVDKAGNRHFLSLAGNFSMSVLSFVTYSILFRTISIADAGNWVFFQSIFALIDTLRSGFLNTGIIKFYSGNAENGEKYAGAGWVIALIITGIVLIINLGLWLTFKSTGDEVWNMILQYSGIALLAILPVNFATWILQSENRFDLILIIRLLSQGSFILFIIALIIIGKLTITSLFLAFILSNLLASVICLLCGWTHFSSIGKADKEQLKTLYHYGKYSIGAVMSSNLLRSSDTFIIKIFLGPAALAVYNLPQRLLEVIEIPLRSFIMTAMPEMAGQMNNNKPKSVIATMKRYAGLLTVFIIPVSVGAILLADLAIWIVGGNTYLDTEAANIFRIFMLLAILFPLDRFIGITIDMINKPHFNLIKVVIMLVVNVCGNLIALYFFKSIYSVAASSVLTLFTGLLFGHLTLKRFIPYSLSDLLAVGYTEVKNQWNTLQGKKALR